MPHLKRKIIPIRWLLDYFGQNGSISLLRNSDKRRSREIILIIIFGTLRWVDVKTVINVCCHVPKILYFVVKKNPSQTKQKKTQKNPNYDSENKIKCVFFFYWKLERPDNQNKMNEQNKMYYHLDLGWGSGDGSKKMIMQRLVICKSFHW